MLHDVSLTDRFDLSRERVLLGGIPALVRALLMQKARERDVRGRSKMRKDELIKALS